MVERGPSSVLIHTLAPISHSRSFDHRLRVRAVAFYGSTQAYWPVLALHGLEDLGHKLNAMTRQGKWSEMAAEVPDDVVGLFARGRPLRPDRQSHWRALRRTDCDALNARANAALPGHLPRDLIQDIRRIPTAFREFVRQD